MSRSKNRVAITGIGVASPYGNHAREHTLEMKKRESRIARLPFAWAAGLKCQIGALVPWLDSIPWLEAQAPEERAMVWAEMAMTEAWLESGLEEKVALCAALGWPWPEQNQPFPRNNTELANSYHHFEESFCFGPVCSSSFSACAASTQAVGEAAARIRRGDVSSILAGGADSRINPMGLFGYDQLGALARGWNDAPERASRPFSKTRSGFVPGEGAAFFLLESWSHAVERNATIYGEILSHACTTDAWRITDPEPNGEQAARCMKLCMERAGILPEQIDLIDCHATSTPANDAAEAAALRIAFGAGIEKCGLLAHKSWLGHLSMAAGTVELATTLLCLHCGFLPGHANADDLEYSFTFPTSLESGMDYLILKNSFGFGGQNCSLLIRAISGHPTQLQQWAEKETQS